MTGRGESALAREIRGPRPMALHLQNSLTLWSEAPAAAARLDAADALWHPDIRGQVAVLDVPDRQAFLAAVTRQAQARQRDFLTGINRYLTHPYRRGEGQAAVSLRLGGCSLFDYGGAGRPLMLIPSLINPSYILDLKPGRSLTDYLKARGWRPFLVDWGWPGQAESLFDTGGYILERLVPFLRHVAHLGGGPVPVVGNCMGGTLAVALATRAGDLVSRLAILAAPWDFSGSLPHAGQKYVPVLSQYLARLPAGMALPVDALQSFFTSVDPTLSSRKFRQFATLDPASEAAEFFVAMETWANSGAPLSRPVAEECLVGWYRGNAPGRLAWHVGGEAVDPGVINCPVWVAAPGADRLVPQASAFAILPHLKQGQAHDPGAGHVGMIVGSRAEAGLWRPLAEWLGTKE